MESKPINFYLFPIRWQWETNRSYLFKLMLACSILTLAACTSAFVSSWKAPKATLVDFVGSKVVALVMIEDVSSRRVAEDILAQEITEQGAQGIPMYTLFPDAGPSKEGEARAALERAGVSGVVVMRPVNVDGRKVVSPPAYPEFWGGYYGYGWGAPWIMSDNVDTNIVYVETRVYSLQQNSLIWSGKSKTVTPDEEAEDLIRKASKALTQELENQGLLDLPFI